MAIAIESFATEALRPKQVRSQLYLQHLVDCAIDIISSDGEDVLTMTLLAERAGVSVGGIYRRFVDKAALELFLKDYYLTQFEIEAKKALEQPADNLAQVVRALFQVHLHRINTQENMWRFIVNVRRDAPARVQRGVKAQGLIEQYFCDAAGKHKNEIAHADTQAALKAAFRLAFAMMSVRLRLAGDVPQTFGVGNLALEAERAIYAYLTTPAPRG